jgi:hypothetical protein
VGADVGVADVGVGENDGALVHSLEMQSKHC